MGCPELGLAARAVVKRVIDGDTMDVELRLPCRVRFNDVSCAERGTEEGDLATERVMSMAPEGSDLVVFIPTGEASNLKDVMTFGRVLGKIWRAGDDETIGQLLKQVGLAHDTDSS